VNWPRKKEIGSGGPLEHLLIKNPADIRSFFKTDLLALLLSFVKERSVIRVRPGRKKSDQQIPKN